MHVRRLPPRTLGLTLSMFAVAGACSDPGAEGPPAFDPDPALPNAGSGGGGGQPSAGGSAGSSGGVAGNGGGPGAGAGGTGPLGGAAGGAQGGNGGAGGSAGSPSDSARVGAELCPSGPFSDPLPPTLTITPLVAVGANDFFVWEGVVWTGDGLYFSEIGSDDGSQINRYTQAGGLQRGVFADTGSNGLAIDPEGNLLLAAHDVGAISSVQLPSGPIARGNHTFGSPPLAFNSPNDLVVRNDGNIYFTDPSFQSPGGRIGATRVYRIAPPQGAGEISVVDDELTDPNGITLSPDGTALYITGAGRLREYALDAAGEASFVRDIADDLQQADGMAIDCAGNIYAVENSARRVRVFSAEGQSIGTIGPAGFGDRGLTNLAFGGANRTTLFVTSFTQGQDTGLYSIELNVPGLPY